MTYRFVGYEENGNASLPMYAWTEQPGRWVTRRQAIAEAADNGHVAIFVGYKTLAARACPR
jgi:hypothetical protein